MNEKELREEVVNGLLPKNGFMRCTMYVDMLILKSARCVCICQLVTNASVEFGQAELLTA